MNNLLSPEPINTGRQAELDIIKGLSIMFMVLIHSFITFDPGPPQQNIPTLIILFLGSPPAAPVFMIALGIGLVYSRKSAPKVLFSRGVTLFILGFVMDIFRDFLPQLWLYQITGNIDDLILGIDWLLGIDILHFAGLTFMFFAAAVKLNFKYKHYFLAAIVFAGINLLVSNIHPQSYALRIIFGMIWGTNEFTWFPFLTWIAFPIFGYLFGQFLIRCTNKRQFYKTVLLCSFSVFSLFFVYSLLRGVDFGELDGLSQEAYFHHDVIGNIVMVSFVYCWAGLFYFASPYIPGLINRTLSRWSKNITTFYWVHWVLLGWLRTILHEYTPLSLPWILLLFAAITAASDFISVYYLKIKSRVIEYKNKEKV